MKVNKRLLIFLLAGIVLVPVPVDSEISKGAGRDIAHFFFGTIPAKKVYKGDNLAFQNESPPSITSFTVTPTAIDLDTRATGTVSFSLVVMGTTGQDTYAQVVRLPGGQSVGATFSGIGGANISDTLPNIPQPNQTTVYRLIARNNGGASHRDTTVTVTQNPALSACTATGRSGGQGAPLGVTVTITCTVRGFPRPVITINQNWQTSQTPDRHFTSSGTNTWTWTDSQFYGTSGGRTFRVTATNSSGTATADVTFNQ